MDPGSIPDDCTKCKAKMNTKVKHEFELKGIPLSTDYSFLWKWIHKGSRVPAYIVYTDEYDEPIWDLVEVKMFSQTEWDIGTRGVSYGSLLPDFESFETVCIKYSLHFVCTRSMRDLNVC